MVGTRNSDQCTSKDCKDSNEEKTYSLKEFVDICNKCDVVVVPEEKTTDLAWKLANDLKACENKEKIIDKENSAFYDYLKEPDGSYNKFTFKNQEGDDKIIAEIYSLRGFYTILDNDKTDMILNQKWHVLISLLALLDMRNIKIDSITVNKKEIKVNSKDKPNRPYFSKPMMEWIHNALKK